MNTPVSSAQILKFLPIGIADGLGLDQSEVQIQSLVPYNTMAQLDFITTTALVFIPSTLVDTLSLDLHTPTAPIYNSNDTSVNTLMGYINPVIPILPGTPYGSTATGTGSGSAASSSAASVNNGVFSTAEQNVSSGNKVTTVGISLGAVGAAAAYGAAMFFIARRYKKKKQSHRRSKSVISPSEMRQSGLGAGAWMTGGRATPGGSAGTNDRNSRGSGRSGGNSARTAQISAPMMAENSLGWN